MSLAEVELEPSAARRAREPTGEPTRAAAALLLEEVRERVLAVREGVPALLGHGVHWVLAVVEALAQLWVRKHFVCLVEQCHLRLGAALVGVSDLCCSAAVEWVRKCVSMWREGGRRTMPS